ncbi:hypothetical protein V5096_19235, partial [Pseudoalteromonas carrageenovora]|uniref:hypothetical protein n=1 Tax=Pseudoalteromonas carrageenovora TaxID=227 RepID=UPI002FD27CD4
MKVERIYKPKFENVSLDEWLESPKRRIKKIPVNISKKRDSLLRFSSLYIDFSRWLTWEVQTPEIESESAMGLRYASKMYAAFLKLAEHP